MVKEAWPKWQQVGGDRGRSGWIEGDRGQSNAFNVFVAGPSLGVADMNDLKRHDVQLNINKELNTEGAEETKTKENEEMQGENQWYDITVHTENFVDIMSTQVQLCLKVVVRKNQRGRTCNFLKEFLQVGHQEGKRFGHQTFASGGYDNPESEDSEYTSGAYILKINAKMNKVEQVS